MFTLLKNGQVYNPRETGRLDILMGAGKIIGIKPEIRLTADFPAFVEVDASKNIIVPGFIDQHVHIAGGGGEGGPATRTPEIGLSQLTRSGVTTVVGLLGADGVTRSVASLLAKARALDEEGITSFIFTGAYEIPTRTISGNVRSDLIFIDKIIGTGEIAISDHRSAQPTFEMLVRLASEARIGGLLGKKAGIVHLHVGEGKQKLSLLFDIIKKTDIPVTQFQPTHVNRLAGLLTDAAKFLKQGGVIDLTAGITPANDSKESMEVWQAIKYLMEEKADLSRVTVSSDGNGSMPRFSPEGVLLDIGVSSVSELWKDVQRVVREGVLPLADAVSLITRNVAAVLRLLPHKGIIEEGSDADIVLLDKNLAIDKVYARGRLMVEGGHARVKGYFE